MRSALLSAPHAWFTGVLEPDPHTPSSPRPPCAERHATYWRMPWLSPERPRRQAFEYLDDHGPDMTCPTRSAVLMCGPRPRRGPTQPAASQLNCWQIWPKALSRSRLRTALVSSCSPSNRRRTGYKWPASSFLIGRLADEPTATASGDRQLASDTSLPPLDQLLNATPNEISALSQAGLRVPPGNRQWRNGGVAHIRHTPQRSAPGNVHHGFAIGGGPQGTFAYGGFFGG